MSATGFTAIPAMLMLDARKDNVPRGGVAVKIIASCAGFSVEAVAEGFIVSLRVIVDGGHTMRNGGRITTKVQRKMDLDKFSGSPTFNPNLFKRLSVIFQLLIEFQK